MENINNLLQTVLVVGNVGNSPCQIICNTNDILTNSFNPLLVVNNTIYETNDFKPIVGGQRVAQRYIDSFYNVYLSTARNTFEQIHEQFTQAFAKTEEKQTYHKEFYNILDWLQKKQNVLLVGPAGTGKSFICEQIAEQLGVECEQSSSVTQEYKITGFVDANGHFIETPFYRAFKNGCLFLLDEVDASLPDALTIINNAIANKKYTFPNGEKVKAHENFYFIASANTYGTGATDEYVGRYQLDAATLNRFVNITIDYDEKVENLLSNNNKDLVDFAHMFRNACNICDIKHIFSYRNITQITLKGDNEKLEKVLQEALIKNLSKDDVRVMLEYMDKANKYVQALVNICK